MMQMKVLNVVFFFLLGYYGSSGYGYGILPVECFGVKSNSGRHLNQNSQSPERDAMKRDTDTYATDSTAKTFMNNTSMGAQSRQQKKGSYLAILTESNACDSLERMEETLFAFQQILLPFPPTKSSSSSSTSSSSTSMSNDSSIMSSSSSAPDKSCPNNNANDDTVNSNGNILISIRVQQPPTMNSKTFQDRVTHVTMELMKLKQKQTRFQNVWVVVNDFAQVAIDAGADGVHVKERHVGSIPTIRQLYLDTMSSRVVSTSTREKGNSSCSVTSPPPLLIGTSAHDIDSALDTWNKYQPDYFFVGTCFITLTHPEKQEDDLEGPLLPGQVKRSILQVLVAQEEEEEQQYGGNSSTGGNQRRARDCHSLEAPLVFAVGGINVDNCRIPIEFGADGVAMIRAVMQAPNPREMVQIIHNNMVIT